MLTWITVALIKHNSISLTVNKKTMVVKLTLEGVDLSIVSRARRVLRARIGARKGRGGREKVFSREQTYFRVRIYAREKGGGEEKVHGNTSGSRD